MLRRRHYYNSRLAATSTLMIDLDTFKERYKNYLDCELFKDFKDYSLNEHMDWFQEDRLREDWFEDYVREHFLSSELFRFKNKTWINAEEPIEINDLWEEITTNKISSSKP